MGDLQVASAEERLEAIKLCKRITSKKYYAKHRTRMAIDRLIQGYRDRGATPKPFSKLGLLCDKYNLEIEDVMREGFPKDIILDE